MFYILLKTIKITFETVLSIFSLFLPPIENEYKEFSVRTKNLSCQDEKILSVLCHRIPFLVFLGFIAFSPQLFSQVMLSTSSISFSQTALFLINLSVSISSAPTSILLRSLLISNFTNSNSSEQFFVTSSMCFFLLSVLLTCLCKVWTFDRFSLFPPMFVG